MSGIVGVFHSDRRPLALSEVQMLSAGSQHPGAQDKDFWSCRSYGVGHQRPRAVLSSPAEEPALASAAGVAVCFDGRLDNREELAQRCVSSLRGAKRLIPDASLVLETYARSDDAVAFASELNGDFAVALFDSRRQQLALARDVMGARPLHYCALPGTLLFASEINCLLAHPRVATAPDEDGIADLVLDKWDDGHRTCFAGIYSVPPGHVLVVTAGGNLALRRHWAFDPAREVRYRSQGEYVEGFRSLFEQAVARRIRSVPAVAVSVSGGIDSSSIFCQAAALRRRSSDAPVIHGITMAFPAGTAADESEFIEQIESFCDTRITRLPVSELRLLRNADNVVRHLEMPGVFWDAYGDVVAAAKELGASVLLDGYFGDQVLFGRGYLVDLFRRGRWLTVHRHVRHFSAWMTDAGDSFFGSELRSTLLRSLPPRWVFQTAKKRAARWRLARYPDFYRREFLDRLLDRQLTRYETTLRFASCHAEDYYRRATAGHDLAHVEQQNRIGLMHGVDVRHPFRDRDLVAFLMAIPGEVVTHTGIPKGLLRQALAATLPGSIRDRRWKADFSAFHLRAVLREHAEMARLMSRDCLSVRAGFVDGKLIEQSVGALKHRIAAGDTQAGWQLTNVVGLELWLRHFFPARFGSLSSCTTS